MRRDEIAGLQERPTCNRFPVGPPEGLPSRQTGSKCLESGQCQDLDAHLWAISMQVVVKMVESKCL